MGPECKLAPVKEEKVEYPSAPPGFKPLTSFTLKRINDRQDMTSEVGSGSHSVLLGTEGDVGEDANLTKFLKSRPWINYPVVDDCKEEDSEPGRDIKNLSASSPPKEVSNGYSECDSSKKVVTKWSPEDGCRPVLGEAPIFHPTEEEFKDALKYIATIRPKAEKYGICRIVPPPSWNPPCVLKETGIWAISKFATCIQHIDKLQNHDWTMEMTIHEYSKRKRRKIQETWMQCTSDNGNSIKSSEPECNNEPRQSGFEPGPFFTLNAFQKYADDFKSNYFGKDVVIQRDHQRVQEMKPSQEEIESEYWRMIEKPTEEIEVLYAAEMDTGVFGSGFPKETSSVMAGEKYLKSDWNLNNLSKLPGSVLSFEKSDISGVLVPRLDVGMCFSSFCWHVEDHYLYSSNYMHGGAPKVWYSVPGGDAPKLEEAMKKHVPDLLKEQPDLLRNRVTQLSPSILTSEGVPVYRCVQNPKEFVLTFPQAYHSSFSCGFNYGEAVNVAPIDWFPHGQHAVEIYREQKRKTTISHDRLLFGAARETVRAQWELQLLRKNTADNLRWKNVCGKEGVLAKTLKQRVEMERTRRDDLCSSYSMKMDNDFDAVMERECVVCLYNLHLSAVVCRCCPDRFACLYHAKQLCECPLSEKTFLYRYTISDLNVLVEALEGKLSAIYKWAKLDLGLAVCSFREKLQPSRPEALPFNSSEGIKQEVLITPNMGSFVTELHQGNSNQKKPMVSSQIECPVNKSVAQLSDDDDGDPVTQVRDRASEGSSDFTGLPGGTATYVDYTKELISKAQQVNMSAMSQMSSMTAEVRKVGNSLYPAPSGSSGMFPQPEWPYGSRKSINESSNEREVSHSDSTVMSPSIAASSSRAPNTGATFYPVKGGKTLRKMNFIVELLELGVVRSGKLWSTCQAIYPKGFMSRVSYLSVLEPEKSCYYVSEILDGGRSGPLFMVKAEACPSEVFIHTSISKCWDMVRDRVNEEILRQGMGRLNLPPFEPQGSIDGLEMFGLTSREIVKRIEEIDPHRVCTEYWRCRPNPFIERGPNKVVDGEGDNPNRSDKVRLNWLLKKANSEELYSLQRIINRDPSLVNELLDEEIKGRCWK
ncbi:hypothetical protein ACHQM5_014076 [Ranunculus cassubicifolius]